MCLGATELLGTGCNPGIYSAQKVSILNVLDIHFFFKYLQVCILLWTIQITYIRYGAIVFIISKWAIQEAITESLGVNAHRHGEGRVFIYTGILIPVAKNRSWLCCVCKNTFALFVDRCTSFGVICANRRRFFLVYILEVFCTEKKNHRLISQHRAALHTRKACTHTGTSS